MHVLFYKPGFAWPRASGHDVHTYQMMRALTELGVEVSVATNAGAPAAALAGIPFTATAALDEPRANAVVRLSGLEERFRSYWGTPGSRIAGLGALAGDLRADVVVVSGLEVLPMLGGINGPLRVWYAGDEWISHHLSQVQWARDSWHNVKDAAIKGLYERAFRRRIDRAWAVSEADSRALRILAGIAQVDTVPNGVDGDRFKACETAVEAPDTAIFWGRLDFGPNIQALQWFVRRVWPALRAARPQARFTIAGFQPGADIRALVGTDGIELLPDVVDLTDLVARHAVVVLPFVSGGGIKNKLLEAAAMSKAIVASPTALGGLNGNPSVVVANAPEEWRTAIADLWSDEAKRHALGAACRTWVMREHTWRAAAEVALRGLEKSLRVRTTR